MSVLILDVEASALERSYPIEIGIADIDAGTVRAWLIRPAEAWAGLDWWLTSERIHGLPQALLERAGEPVEKVAAEIVAFVAGRPLLSDNPPYDQNWLTMALEAGGQSALPVDRQPLPRALADLVHSDGRDPVGHDALIDARVEAFDHSAAGDAAAWAAALELAGQRPSPEQIRAAFSIWKQRARAASPWRSHGRAQ